MLVQEELHKAAHAEAHGVGALGIYPLPDVREQLLRRLFEAFQRHLVAGRPVVNIGQEFLRPAQALLLVPDSGNNERMELILVKVPVRKLREKCTVSADLFRKLPKLRSAHAYHVFRIHSRDKPALKIAVFYVLHGEKPASYLVCCHFCNLSGICPVLFMVTSKNRDTSRFRT